MRSVVITGILAASLALSGCVESTGSSGASTSSGKSASTAMFSSGKTAQEKALEREAASLTKVTDDIVARNTVQGALAGAAAGCGLALLMGGNSKDCARGAVAGAVVGGVGGNAVGRQAAQKKTKMVQQDRIIAKLKGVNQKLASVEGKLRAVVRSQNTELASLRRQLSAKQISASSYKSRVSAINSNRASVMNSLAASENNLTGERTQLVKLERETGQRLTQSKGAVSSTQKRIARLRNSVALIPTK